MLALSRRVLESREGVCVWSAEVVPENPGPEKEELGRATVVAFPVPKAPPPLATCPRCAGESSARDAPASLTLPINFAATSMDVDSGSTADRGACPNAG